MVEESGEDYLFSETCFVNVDIQQLDRNSWPAMKKRIVKFFRTATKWCRIMEGGDVCFAPVLSMEEAPRHPYNREPGPLSKRTA